MGIQRATRCKISKNFCFGSPLLSHQHCCESLNPDPSAARRRLNPRFSPLPTPAMSFDLVLNPSCEASGAKSDLYGTECKHTTPCTSCGKTMAVGKRRRCNLCRTFSTKIIKDEEGEEVFLSKWVEKLKKLLGEAAGANESHAEDDDDNDDADDGNTICPVLFPTTGSARGTPSSSKSSKSRRNPKSDDEETAHGSSGKKMKVENESKSRSVGPVTEVEVISAILEKDQTMAEFIKRFKPRIKTKQAKASFTEIMISVSRMRKDGVVTIREEDPCVTLTG